jgi:carboxypeptidase C (cathepsin A)
MAIGTLSGDTNSAVGSAVYVINSATPAPAPAIFALNGGVFTFYGEVTLR